MSTGVKIWEKSDWTLEKDKIKSKSNDYHLYYRGQLKLSFPASLISLYELTFLPQDGFMGIRSMGQLILKVVV